MRAAGIITIIMLMMTSITMETFATTTDQDASSPECGTHQMSSPARDHPRSSRTACCDGDSRQSQPSHPPTPTPLRLLTWLSPAFPTGGFAYSHGLEWAVEAGDVINGDTLQVWLTDILAHGAGRSDTILLRHAHRAAAAHDTAALRDIADLALATAPSRERHAEALNQGRAFLLAAAPWHPPELPDDTPYAVAVGALAGTHGIAEDDTAAAYLQAFAASLISAAVRLVPLGQTAGLRVLAALEPTIIATADATHAASLDDLGGCVLRSDLAAMRHETQYTRLFRS
jgi:urease accessory protein